MALDYTQVGSRLGYLGWYAYSQALNGTFRPAVEIELFIKDHSIPSRKPKYSELYTVSRFDPSSDVNINVSAITEGAPDLLSVTLSGFTKTELSVSQETGSLRYRPLDANGDPLVSCVGLTYVEVISDYLSGVMNISRGGGMQRKDPDYFISPYGHRYGKPIVQIWEPEAVASFAKKHNFSCTLLLER